MERLDLVRIPVNVAKFIGHQLAGGAWSELPPLPQGEIHRPVRASLQFYRTPDVPDNIIIGEE